MLSEVVTTSIDIDQKSQDDVSFTDSSDGIYIFCILQLDGFLWIKGEIIVIIQDEQLSNESVLVFEDV